MRFAKCHIPFFAIISFSVISPCLLAAQSSANPPPSNPRAQSNNNQPVIAKLSPSNCINPGARIIVMGENLKTAKDQFLMISDLRPPIQLTISNWTDRKITAIVPKNIKADTKKPYRLGLRNKNSQRWLIQSEPMLTFCSRKIASISASNNTNPDPGSSAPPTSPRKPAKPAVSTQQEEPPADQPSQDTQQEREAEREQDSQRTVDNDKLIPESPIDRSGSLMGRGLPPPPQVNIMPPSSQEPDYETNQLVVLSANMQEANQLAKSLRNFSLRIKSRKQLSSLGLVISVFKTPKGADLNELTEQIRNNNPSVWIDLNHHYQLLSDPRHSIGQTMIEWPERCNKPVKIGQIDTWVDLNHSILESQKITAKSFRPKQSEPVKDGHGNAIASLLVGGQNKQFPGGLLNQGHLFAADVFWQNSNKKYTSTEWILKGLDWLVGREVTVINMSFGGRKSLLLELAIDRLTSLNILVVAAAGNSGKDAPPKYPAAFEQVVAVTAIDSEQRLYKKANQGNYIDFAAPGVSIWTAYKKNGYKYQQGTSFAAPFVTALAAVTDLEALKASSVDLGEPGKDSQFGWGLLKINGECK